MLTQIVSPPTGGHSMQRSTAPNGGHSRQVRRSATRSRSALAGCPRLVDLHQAGVVRVAARHRVVLELTEAPGEGDMLGAGDVLVAQEQHLVLEQQSLDLGEQIVVVRGVAQVDAEQLGADVAGQRLDLDRLRPTATTDGGSRGASGHSGLGHGNWIFPLELNLDRGRHAGGPSAGAAELRLAARGRALPAPAGAAPAARGTSIRSSLRMRSTNSRMQPPQRGALPSAR